MAVADGPTWGFPIFCGVAQIVVPRSHKPVGGGASPPATSICSQHRRAAEPYKLGRPGGLPGTAGLDIQDYNHMSVARGISGTVLRTRIAMAGLHSRVPIHTHADGTSAPALLSRVAGVRLTPW